jgi:predicted phage tail protein
MSKPIISGAGKGGSQRTPKEHPNTLQARSVAKIIDLISEGPIYGLARTADDPLRSIFMDDTPVKNADGSFNYEGVDVYERFGTEDQGSMPGFAQVETEQSVNVTLTKQNPVLFTIENSNVKQIRLKVRLNSLYRQNTKNGDVEPTSVKIKIELGSSGDSGASAVDDIPLTAGVDTVTVTEQGEGYTTAPTVNFVGGDGSGAAATATITDGKVTSITVTSPGSGYTEPPRISFSMPSGAYDKEATAECTLLPTGGSGYTAATTVTLTGGSPDVVATAVPEIEDGVIKNIWLTTGVASIRIDDPGMGYDPATVAISLSGGGGTGAAASLTLDDLGSVESITVTNSGSGYTEAPTVDITGHLGEENPRAQFIHFASGIRNAEATAIGKLAGGSGYTSAPTVVISDSGGGTGATAIAKVSPYHIYGGEITISGKTVGAYEESYFIDLEEFSNRLVEAGLPAAAYPITVRVSRLTEDSESATVQDTLAVSTYTEIQPYNLRYPDSALIGLVVDAQKFGGNVPRRSFDVLGKLVDVPTGYEAENTEGERRYPDFWDGTFEQRWSNNPAWVMLDLLTNERYGLGLDRDTDIDVYSLYSIAKYCDELVPVVTIDAAGVKQESYEYRYVCNTTINSRKEAYQVLQAIASCFRGMVYASTSGVAFSQDRPKDPVRLVAPADVIDGNFTYSSTSRKARHSVALITWNDPDDNYKQAVEVYEDLDLIDRYGYNPIEVVAYGTTSQSQARRMGKWILDSEKHETDTVTFQGGLDFIDLMPGDIIAVADPMKQNSRLGGRIMNYSFESLTPSSTVTSTTTSGSAIGSLDYTTNAVFECVVKIDPNVQPTGCIWEVGNSTTGAYLGFDTAGGLVLRAGYGGSDFEGNPNDIARLVVPYAKLPVGRQLTLLAHIDPAGRVRLWGNSQFLGEASTADGSSFGGTWAASSGAKYGGSSGDIVAGEVATDTNVTLVSDLSYWDGGVVRTVIQTFTLDQQFVDGDTITTTEIPLLDRGADATFECSFKTPASGTTPTGLIAELGNGSSSATEGMYVGFDAEGNLVIHAGEGVSVISDGAACRVTVPATFFAADTQYHLLWSISPTTGRLLVWVDWEFYASSNSPGGLKNQRFADAEDGGYGVLSSNTVVDQVTTAFNGTLLTPLRYYGGEAASYEQAPYGTITLDAPYSVQDGDKIMFMTREMLIDTVDLKAGTTTAVVKLGKRPTGEPITDAMYVIQAAAANAKEYRVLSLREVEQAKYEVTALEYDKTKFARIEQDILVDRPSTDLFPKGAVTPPTELSYIESLYRTASDVATRIDLSCLPSTDPRVTAYQWDVSGPLQRAADGTQEYLPLITHSSPFATVLDAVPGIWKFRVTALAGGTKSVISPPLELSNVTIYGKQLPPEDVTGLLALRGFSKIRLKWNPVTDLDLRDYVIIQDTSWPDDLSTASPVYSNSTDITIDVDTTADITFLVKARDTSGNLSSTAASITAQVLSLGAVTNLTAHGVYSSQSYYSADARLSWEPLSIRNEVVSYEVRATDELEDSLPGGAWDDLQTRLETTDPQGLIKVTLEDATATTYEFKVRPFVSLANGSRNYGTESSVQRLMNPGNGSSHKIQDEHTTWPYLPSNEAQAFVECGVGADQSTPQGGLVYAAYGAGWRSGDITGTDEFDRRASGVWAVTIQVANWSTVRGCLFEMGNSNKGCYLGFDGGGNLVWRAGANNSTPTDYARSTITSATLSAAISTGTDFTIVCDVRNDGTNSGRARLWVIHAGGVITATPGETSDASAFANQTWATNRDGKVNGYFDSIISGESAGYAFTPTSYGVTYSSEVEYWHDVLVQSPLSVSSGKLLMAEGITFAKYTYDFDLNNVHSGEVNYLFRATNVPATRLKVYDTFNQSVNSFLNVKITPAFEPSPDNPAIAFYIESNTDNVFTEDYEPLVTATAYRFQYAKVKMELRREANSEYRPEVSFLQTTMSNGAG